LLGDAYAPTDLQHDLSPGLVADLAIKSSTSGESGGAGSQAAKSVLLIEDDPAISEMYRYQLETDGYRVEVASNGNSGWELIQSMKPDVVLLDIRLPGMDGFQILEAVREHKLAEIPVVVLSNFGDAQMMQRAKALGVREYLVKSRITPEQISARIPLWIERKTLQ
jgi:DNA-binding response OmpR family regulator